jgi:hypothetical protein
MGKEDGKTFTLFPTGQGRILCTYITGNVSRVLLRLLATGLSLLGLGFDLKLVNMGYDLGQHGSQTGLFPECFRSQPPDVSPPNDLGLVQ